MTNYEDIRRLNRLNSIITYTEKKNQRPTTVNLWETRDVADFHSLRSQLADLEKDGLALRHPEDNWRWSVTREGWDFYIRTLAVD